MSAESSSESEAGLKSSSQSGNESVKGCYLNEPEYTLEEVNNKLFIDESDESSSDNEVDSSRLENLHWCSCESCVIFQEMRPVECKCCREYESLLSDKLTGIKCVASNEEFKILCLNKVVLETACIRQRRYQNKFMDKKIFTNK